MMPAASRKVAPQLFVKSETLPRASVKSPDLWRMRDGRHYNARVLKKPKCYAGFHW